MDQKIRFGPDAEKSILKSEFLRGLPDKNLQELLEATREKLKKISAKEKPDAFLTEGFQADIEKIEAEIENRKSGQAT